MTRTFSRTLIIKNVPGVICVFTPVRGGAGLWCQIRLSTAISKYRCWPISGKWFEDEQWVTEHSIQASTEQ